MRTYLLPTLVCALVAWLGACQSTAPAIEQAENFDWSSVETFSWLDRPQQGPYDTVITDTVEGAMAAKGYRMVEAEGDLIVLLEGGLKGRMYSGNAVWSLSGPEASQSGGVSLGLVHSATQSMVWRGSVERKFPADQTQDERAAMLRGILEELLAELPAR